MNVSDIGIFCGTQDHTSKNKTPALRISSDASDDYVVAKINFGNQYSSIKIFMSEQDLINFKNSVVNAVNNYKKGKPELSAEAILKREA